MPAKTGLRPIAAHDALVGEALNAETDIRHARFGIDRNGKRAEIP
ncbi:hypothetical protein ACIF80_25100 [Streptomyces sp. NPDC085927]